MSDSNKKHIEIINGSELNKTIDDRHLGKSFRDVLFESLPFSKNIDKEIEYIIDTNCLSSKELLKTNSLLSIISKNEDSTVKIIQLSNIIIKLAIKYTEDIFLKKKKKEILKEINELMSQIEIVKKILESLKKDITQNNQK